MHLAIVLIKLFTSNILCSEYLISCLLFPNGGWDLGEFILINADRKPFFTLVARKKVSISSAICDLSFRPSRARDLCKRPGIIFTVTKQHRNKESRARKEIECKKNCIQYSTLEEKTNNGPAMNVFESDVIIDLGSRTRRKPFPPPFKSILLPQHYHCSSQIPAKTMDKDKEIPGTILFDAHIALVLCPRIIICMRITLLIEITI